MKRLTAALLMLSGLSLSQADTLDLHLWSVHDRAGFEDRNWGLGLQRDSGLALGAYRNSMRRGSVYVGWSWETASRPLSVAVTAGLVTGYPQLPVSPFIIPSVAWHLTERTEVRLAVAPKPPLRGGAACVHLMIGVRI